MSNMNDYRVAWALKQGDTIQTTDTIYTITGDPIGFGGSSILYPASRSGSALDYAIKECMPRSPENYCRQNGIVQVAKTQEHDLVTQTENYKDSLAVLNRCRDMLTKEREIGQKIRNSTMRAVSVWESLNPIAISTDGKTFTEVSEGIFSVLERVDKKGRFFNELLDDIWNAYPPEKRRKTRGLPSIYVTACLMEEVLFALQKIHDKGHVAESGSHKELIEQNSLYASMCHTIN